MKKWILFAFIALAASSLLAQATINRSLFRVGAAATDNQGRDNQTSTIDRDLALLSMAVAEQNAVIASAQRLGVGMETVVFNTSQTRQVSIPAETEFVVISNHTALAETSPEVAVLDLANASRDVALGDVLFRARDRTRLTADRAAGQTFVLIFVKQSASAAKNIPRTAASAMKTPLVPIAPSPQCSNNGSLIGSTCLCFSGFTGATCSSCASNYYNYPTCTYCLASTTCKGHGTCTSSGKCNCAAGYVGPDCSCK